jgi:hypothetical protein
MIVLLWLCQLHRVLRNATSLSLWELSARTKNKFFWALVLILAVQVGVWKLQLGNNCFDPLSITVQYLNNLWKKVVSLMLFDSTVSVTVLLSQL